MHFRSVIWDSIWIFLLIFKSAYTLDNYFGQLFGVDYIKVNIDLSYYAKMLLLAHTPQKQEPMSIKNGHIQECSQWPNMKMLSIQSQMEK